MSSVASGDETMTCS